jgi:DNA-binding transcriptional ArsR family regulator
MGSCALASFLKELSITQGTLSHHMKDLAASGIVVVRKEGKWCHYSLNAKASARWPIILTRSAALKRGFVRLLRQNKID